LKGVIIYVFCTGEREVFYLTMLSTANMM